MLYGSASAGCLPPPLPPLPSVQDAVDVAHYYIIDPSSTARFNSPGFNWSLIFIKSPDWIPRSTRSTPDALRVKRDPSVIRAVSRSKRCQSALPVPPIPMLRIPNFGSSCELAPRSIADPVRLDCLFVCFLESYPVPINTKCESCCLSRGRNQCGSLLFDHHIYRCRSVHRLGQIRHHR